MIYDEPIGEEDDIMTLMFPGDVSGSSPKRVVPERVGTRTLVFDTPGKYFRPLLTLFAAIKPGSEYDARACVVLCRRCKMRKIFNFQRFFRDHT